jgi:hypothetical protein
LTDEELRVRQLGYEVRQLTKDFASVAGTVAQELMHPHTGVVVGLRHLENDVRALDEQLALLVTAKLEERIVALEARLVLVLAVLGAVGATVLGIIASFFMK